MRLACAELARGMHGAIFWGGALGGSACCTQQPDRVHNPSARQPGRPRGLEKLQEFGLSGREGLGPSWLKRGPRPPPGYRGQLPRPLSGTDTPQSCWVQGSKEHLLISRTGTQGRLHTPRMWTWGCGGTTEPPGEPRQPAGAWDLGRPSAERSSLQSVPGPAAAPSPPAPCPCSLLPRTGWPLS